MAKAKMKISGVRKPTMSFTLNLFRQYKQAYAIRKFAKHISAQIRKEGGFYRKQGHIYPQDIQLFASSLSDLSGAFVEIGVRYGNTFRHLLPIAQQQSKVIYAVDSFQGTKKNSPYDGRPDFDMSIGGFDVFLKKMREKGFVDSEFSALVGWIPEVFQQFPDNIQFSFAILDVDNYTPTKDSLEFVWPRLQPGGILFCDDFCTYHQIDAGRAIREFLSEMNDYWIERIFPNYQIVFRKTAV
jgi:hypothetical protein